MFGADATRTCKMETMLVVWIEVSHKMLPALNAPAPVTTSRFFTLPYLYTVTTFL